MLVDGVLGGDGCSGVGGVDIFVVVFRCGSVGRIDVRGDILVLGCLWDSGMMAGMPVLHGALGGFFECVFCVASFFFWCNSCLCCVMESHVTYTIVLDGLEVVGCIV